VHLTSIHEIGRLQFKIGDLNRNAQIQTSLATPPNG